MSARFALRRVVAAGVPQREQEPLWLLIEWRDGEPEPANSFLVSLPERRTKKQLIRLVMQRWRTERVYEDLKGELGLDHYEGCRFPARLAMARVIATWLPRCPTCHRANLRRFSLGRLGLPVHPSGP